jgi:hypothetical protein
VVPRFDVGTFDDDVDGDTFRDDVDPVCRRICVGATSKGSAGTGGGGTGTGRLGYGGG